jgi:ribosomal protein L23
LISLHTLMHVVNKFHTSAVFYVPPKMTKFEVKEYLTKIYNVSVKSVRTANFLGKRRLEESLLENDC